MSGTAKNPSNSTASNSTDSSLRPETNVNKARKSNKSQTTLVSIQNFEFTGLTPNEGGRFNVKQQKNLLQFSEMNVCPTIKERGYDFTSSTNSHFDQMAVTVPKRPNKKYSSVSVTESNRRKSQSLETIKSSKQSVSAKKETSQELFDSHHECSKKPKHFQGAEWRKPCKESFVAGAPRKFLGTCPPNFQQISKMSKMRQKFFITQDPRKVHCLVNPAVLRAKQFSQAKEFNALTKMVKQAQNVCAAEASETSDDFICEVIDLENPLQLDFQGLDYSNTYRNDEQDLQNQFNYRRIYRYMERRRAKVETKRNVEEALHQEKINVPKRFQVRDRNEPPAPVQPEAKVKLGELFRSADKPYNQKRIEMERENRNERYKNLYLKKKAREDQQKRNQELEDKNTLENLYLTLTDKNFAEFVKYIDENIERTTADVAVLEEPKIEKSGLPQNMLQTKQFKIKLKQENLIAREKAKIAKEFFLEKTGKVKEFPAADSKISSQASVTSDMQTNLSQESTDDEDGMTVGKRGSKFKIRGFQFHIGSNLGRKPTQHEKLHTAHKAKGCITRDEWLNELAPKKQHIKLDVEMGIQKLRSPDDPKLVLFPPHFGFRPPQAKHSTIRNFIEKPLGRHYDRDRRKELKFAKPRLRYNVKKFNLIKYRFGDTVKRFSQLTEPVSEVQVLKLQNTSEYMAAKAVQKKQRQEEIKRRRLKLLGIPCKSFYKSRLQIKCENSSSSSNSDWIPQKEPELPDSETAEGFNVAQNEIKPLSRRWNMPAPKYREPTLRQHPRRPRDYDNERVPSEIFDQTVLTTNLPYLNKLDKDKIKFANVEQKKTPYTEKFEARHHHDHWDATQVKQVDVQYQPLVVKPEIVKGKKKSNRQVMENFQMSDPPCNQFVDMDLSLPHYNIEEMLANYRTSNNTTKIRKSDIKEAQNLCIQTDYVQRSRDAKELEDLDYPGRKEYLQLLRDVRELYDKAKETDEASKLLHINKDDLIKDLEEDLKSIESCLTSLSSSVCTNLTNDSGSFLLMEGKEKIPLDFIRKSLVPFEELQRSRFQAIPIDIDKERNNPFQVMPFAGQKQAQLELSTAKDTFFTFNTRLKNGMRLRLEVPLEDVREQLLGKDSNKHKSVVATDIDESYIEELKIRPPTKQVKFKSGQLFVKNALRLKFESMLIQGEIVRTKIYDRLNEQHWLDMQKAKELFEELFAKWEKEQYDAAMAFVYKVKRFYDETDSLKTAFKQLERELSMLNMDIVFIEGHWARCVMLQNFHYLMGDIEWRLRHDWIHRLDDAETELENFEESIAKRSTLNIRKRDKDDAWAIKAFYEQEYSQNKHENLIVFPNAAKFEDGLKNLKTKTFIILLEMHFTLGIQTELQHKVESFVDWCTEDLHEREEYVNKKCAKLYFMTDRGKWLNQRTLNFLDAPIEKCFKDELFYKDRAAITEAFKHIAPANLRGTNGNEFYTIDMVATIFEVLMDILAKFETIPMDLTQQVEKNLRAYRNFLRKQSHQAYHIERRIEKEMKKVVENLQPPYQKPKRPSRLPRYHLKRREKPVPVKAKVITDRARFLFRAFNEGEMTDENVELKDSFIQVGAEKEQIVPFYFDHFLKLNGYTPNYNFKTHIELRDGPEIDRLQIKSVIPDVQEHMEYWQNLKRMIMEDNIARNPKIYVNVMT